MSFATVDFNNVVTIANLICIFVSMLLGIIVLITSIQMRVHNSRMGWFIASICVVMGGLTFQLGSTQVYSRIFFSLVAPLFGLYFIDTEREEGQKWDGKFWTTVQGLFSLLVLILALSEIEEFFVYSAFLIQYMVVIVMLLVSSKRIRESIGFLLACLFPITTSLVGMGGYGLHFMGLGIIMMLLIVFFGYQMDMERELLERKVELTENRVSLLMEQIHPHFIYNSLQQIALLCDEDADAVKPAIFNFSAYLRKNFEALTNEKMIPFSQEMEHVDAYVALSSILPSRNFIVKKDFQISDFYLPALVIQPLVENAIYYGLSMSEKGDEILIQTKEEKGYIIITVKDDGHGKKTEISTQKKHKSVGTQNVKTRLSLLCDGEMTLNKSPQGTEAIIKIPANKAVKK
ncbi:MAG: histidine kinase [Eubacterium sp.]|nr:histidine kinase [Eubacterium sp.]